MILLGCRIPVPIIVVDQKKSVMNCYPHTGLSSQMFHTNILLVFNESTDVTIANEHVRFGNVKCKYSNPSIIITPENLLASYIEDLNKKCEKCVLIVLYFEVSVLSVNSGHVELSKYMFTRSNGAESVPMKVYHRNPKRTGFAYCWRSNAWS